MTTLFDALGPTRPIPLEGIGLSLLVSFLLATILGKVFQWTHTGPSYSRSIVQTVVLGCLIATVMIIAIGNNLARGLGILGTLALVRFRTPIRDPRDITFIFASLALGVASGAQLYELAVLATLFFCLVTWILSWSPFSSRRDFEGLLRFILPPGSPALDTVRAILSRYAVSAEMLALREATQGELMEYSYQVRLHEPSERSELLASIQRIEEVSEASLVLQRSTVEI